MIQGIYNVITGAVAQEKKLSVIANNIANANTAGFKAVKLIFEAVDSEAIYSSDAPTTTFTATFDSFTDFTDAALVQTGAVLDVAIQGSGFFVIQTPQGTRYTRNGQFTLDSEKRLVTADGFPVMGEGGEMTLDGNEIAIETDGSIYVDKVSVGRLKVVDFTDKRSLLPEGRGMFVNSDPAAAEAPAERYVINQGSYEASNVQVVQEMVEMVSTMRAYEAYSKVTQSVNDIYGKLLDVSRG